METILKTKSLTKRFRKKIAVDSVNMEIKKGDIYGFIGKNGAGKTTLIRTVAGLAAPTSGSIELFGSKDLNKGRKKMGAVIESPALYPYFTARQNLELQKKLLGNDKNIDIDELLNIVGLKDTGRKKAKEFSLGMKQRLAIAIALVGNPEFLILDEPINGLDPAGVKDVRDMILHLNKNLGITVLISSHILEELSKIATRYGVISDGVLVDQFSKEELANRVRQFIEIEVDDLQKAMDILKENMKIRSADIVDGKIRLYEHNDDAGQINIALAQNGVMVKSLSGKGDPESYFIDLIGGKAND